MRINTSILSAAAALAATQTALLTVRPSPDGWRIYAKSTSGASLVDLSISRSAFGDSWEQWETFAVRTDRLVRGLRRMGPVTELTLMRGFLTLASPSTGLSVRLGGCVPELGDPRSPAYTVTASCTVAARPLLEFFRLADERTADAVSLRLDRDGLRLRTAEAGGLGAGLRLAPEQCLELDVRQGAKAVYSLAAWKAFATALGRRPTLTLRLGTDYPVAVGFGAGDSWSGVWVLSPWVADAPGHDADGGLLPAGQEMVI